jgi:DNA (cytosine-5)-methyltransferase 1
MRRNFAEETPNSRRLAQHKDGTVEYFRRVQAICRPGVCMSKEERVKVGTKKHSTTVLNADRPSPTITTLPDDIIHYSEPRILTARENARLQSFPDWFAFQGKYTTGGKQRKQECPRYTQIGNAVPPLLATAIGELLKTRQTRPVTQKTNKLPVAKKAALIG